MKFLQKNIFLVFVILAIVANIYIFLQGLTLGDQISTYEQKIASLKDENNDLEKRVYELQSYTRASSLAAQLDFTKQTTPVYIDNLLYATNF